MAARNFNSKGALEREIKDVYVKVSIAAAGAPSLVSGSAVGAASIVRNSDGDYTLTLSDAYKSLRFAKIKLLSSTAQDLRAQLVADSVASSKSIRFVMLADNVETDPASGSVLLIKLELKNAL